MAIKEVIFMQNLENLECFIRDGLELIRSNDYRGAISHFRNRQIAADFCFDLEVREGRIANALNYQDFRSRIFLNSMQYAFFAPEGERRGQLVMGGFEDACLVEGFFYRGNDNSESTRLEQAEVFQNTVLSHAETWLHGLYFLRCGDTRNGNEFVVTYMQEHEIPLAFIWASRHSLPWRVG